MDERDNVKAMRQKTLAERVTDLETHHEETRTRINYQQQQIQHERERVDTVLGAEPSIVETPAQGDAYGR